jgi:hypothetical protein
MDIQSIRRARLAQLITEKYHGSQAAFVDATNANQGEVSALLKNKSFGEKKARKIEADCGAPVGWLDTPKDEEPRRVVTHIVPMPRPTDVERAFTQELSALLNGYARADAEGRRSILRFVKSRETASDQSTDATSTD